MKTKSTSQLRLVEIKSLAIETFGTLSKAEHWLNNVNLTFGDTPLSFAKTESGSIEVKKVLNAINYGI